MSSEKPVSSSTAGDAASAADAPRLPKDSERRLATVLFADISGFTAMAEKLDPEEVTSTINRCFATLAAAVAEHGGYVDKYIGD
jgi:class 3 adenylate cyclase